MIYFKKSVAVLHATVLARVAVALVDERSRIRRVVHDPPCVGAFLVPVLSLIDATTFNDVFSAEATRPTGAIPRLRFRRFPVICHRVFTSQKY